ncbi:hypothetical protein BASA50_000620 [Batrachochytrium salamandrivorans]|uniref:EGF-like domain-containing protein n=1 Tax=Batrachochytrium salamandrivorans TaxID=1357716 RepID=A0ABQ8EU41_9FUNG|nr:hypothetical protein BASA50_000620 [Batrachochytrium salamandrivorans]KAH9272975.1 hypothetical protein BASA83_004868 [Batrachochytrium salamandrivorans]
MLSKLIITFLCAATIGSVSGAFLTFHPAQFVLKDIAVYTSFTVKLNSKPTEDVKVYFQHQSMLMSKCMIVFSPATWDAPQYIDVIPVPLFLGTSLFPGPLEAESKVLAKAITVGPLSPELSSTDTMEVKQTLISTYQCSITDSRVETFDKLLLPLKKLGWYWMLSTGDLAVQVKVAKCTEKQLCIKTVLVRYGTSVMSMDVSGPAKNFRDYSIMYLTTSTNGLRYIPGASEGVHILNFPYGSSLTVKIVNNNGIMSLDLIILLYPGYSSPKGLCNKPRDESPDNMLIGSNGRSYRRMEEFENFGFFGSWGVKAKDVLTNPGATALQPSIQFGTVCKIPDNLQPKPVDPVLPKPVDPIPPKPVDPIPPKPVDPIPPKPVDPIPPKPVDPVPPKPVNPVPPKPTTAAATTTTTTSYSASTIYLPPPSLDGYIPPPPPPPPDVVAEIQKCCQSIFNIPSCNAIVPAESYIQSCILDAQTSGSYVSSDKVKQAYLAKCRTLTDDMIRGTTKGAIDQGTKIKKEYGFGNVTCINSCSGQGTCTDFGCACSPGFSGMDCSMDLTKATQYDQSVDQYRINANVTVAQQQTEQHSKLPGSDPYATPVPSATYAPYATPVPSATYAPYAPYGPSVHSAPSVDQSLASFVDSLPKSSAVNPHIVEESQPSYPKPDDDFQKPILSSSISLGSLHIVSVAVVVITSYILLL